MTPQNDGFLSQEFDVEEQTGRTYQMNFDKLKIQGFADNQAAAVQAIYKILNTERYQYAVYSWDYGVELLDLFGEPISYVIPEIERRITEALTSDDRILSVDDFDFEVNKGTVQTTFTVHTVYGDIFIEKAVSF